MGIGTQRFPRAAPVGKKFVVCRSHEGELEIYSLNWTQAWFRTGLGWKVSVSRDSTFVRPTALPLKAAALKISTVNLETKN